MGAWRRWPSWIVGIFILLLCYVHKKNLSLTSLTILDFVVFFSPSPLVLGNRLFPFHRTWSHEILTALVSKVNPGPGPGHDLTRITFVPIGQPERLAIPEGLASPSLGFHVYRFFRVFVYLFMALLGLCCCVGFSLVAVHGLLIVVASLVSEHRL